MSERFGKVRPTIAYEEDVHVWVYLDQVDRVVRYEAYVIGYDEAGEPSTLEFVLEEGVLDNMHEVPLFQRLLQTYREAFGRGRGAAVERPFGLQWSFLEGTAVSTAPLVHFYKHLDEEDLLEVHSYFYRCEQHLKEERRKRWSRMLSALGYDVIPSLHD